MSIYAGGEFLCLNVCSALQEMGYRVSLACDVFRPSEFERLYGLGNVMEKCDHVNIPDLHIDFPHFVLLQRAAYVERVRKIFSLSDADIVFSTQSSHFIVPRRMFHFVYDAGDVLSYPAGLGPLRSSGSRPGPKGFSYRVVNKILWGKRPQSQDWFFAVGSNVLSDLRNRGYRNSSMAFPPCRANFRPRTPKKKQVVQSARIVPNKRLELYFEMAARLPDFEFILVGRNDPLLQKQYPGYLDQLLSKRPNNVTYVEGSTRSRPELVEESKVYVYTGDEKGIVLSLVEAIGAGCFPFSPVGTGAADVLRALNVGEVFNTMEEAVVRIRLALERQISKDELNVLSERAKMLGPEAFKQWITKIAQTGRPILPDGSEAS